MCRCWVSLGYIKIWWFCIMLCLCLKWMVIINNEVNMEKMCIIIVDVNFVINTKRIFGTNDAYNSVFKKVVRRCICSKYCPICKKFNRWMLRGSLRLETIYAKNWRKLLHKKIPRKKHSSNLLIKQTEIFLNEDDKKIKNFFNC